MTDEGNRESLVGKRMWSLDFWARVQALFAAFMLALGLTLWTLGTLRGWRWVCYPASFECLGLAILLRIKHRVLANLLLALSLALIMADLALLALGW
jgi:hypothetical protein